ncbi:MAG TPA: protein kinase [Myxococcaceae bacterium]|nr:protein kinase [Myxococcaceae bacterium]
MRLAPGHKLGPYEVLSVVGAGGMAEVYRARDPRLGRDIALKVVNESLAASPELVRRFEQEARIAGSLNHPNIVAVYDVGIHDGTPYFVTELLEGETLRQRLARGRVPLGVAVDWGIQLAHGLAAAHRRGIVHRDVKPENVFITPSGQVKVLDFGIAKLAEEARAGPRDLMEATLHAGGGGTRTGSVIGTPGYMSPEQVRGDPVDARTDIFSLGAVLYELLSGTRAFPGASLVESGYAILNEDPPPLPASVPSSIGQVILRCLQKDPEHRFQLATDLAFALEVVRSPTTSAAPLAAPRRSFLTPALLGAVALAMVVGTLVWRGRSGSADAPRPEVQQVVHRLGTVRAARFAPDGRIIFSASFEGKPEEVFGKTSTSIEPQSLGVTDALLLGVSRSGDLALLLEPRFSRGFSMHGTLARVGGVGGTPRELVERVEFADWSPTGELAVVRDLGARITLEFPVGKVLFQTTGWLSNPRFSPSGDRIAFLHHPLFNDDMGEPMVVDLNGQSKSLTPRWPRVLGLAWSPDGSEVLFTAGQVQRNVLVAVSTEGRVRELYASPADLRLEDIAPDGSVLATEQIERSELGFSTAGQGEQSTFTFTWGNWATAVARVSDQGSALVGENAPLPPEQGQGPLPTQPVLALLRRPDRNAAQILGSGSPLDLSPDGRWALVIEPDRRTLTALPIGPGQSRALQTDGLELSAARWFRDGKRLLATCRTASDVDFHLYVLPQDGSSGKRLSDTPVIGRRILHLSPDDRWAATLDKNEVLVLLSTTDGRVTLLPEAGPDAVPRGWSSDGHLWVTRGGDRTPARARLLRFDVERHRLLEERAVVPPEISGTIYLRDVAISPDGRSVAFVYGRNLGSLYVLRGLLRDR